MDNNYKYNYDAPTTDTVTSGAGLLFIGIIFLFLIIVAIIFYAVSAFLLGRIFKKAGEPQWSAWVPIYNTWKLLEIGGQQGFWAILALLPFVNIISAVYMYIAMFKIGKNLGKEDWFILLAIFVPIIWMIWLAFDDSKWPTQEIAEKAKLTKKPANEKTAKQ
ncbi:MAG: DUF5684 domain-containing protein [Candidatus Saccharimonadales bacterium]